MSAANASSVARPTLPSALAGGDALVLGEDGAVARLLSLVLERLGARAVEIVDDAEAALDLMGDDRRRWRLVVVLPPSEDVPSGRLLAVLRDLRYPVHASAIVEDARWDPAPRPDLIGCGLVSDLLPPKPFARGVADLVTGPWTVARIVESARVPPDLAPHWSCAVYGTAPGRSWASPTC